MTYQEFCDTWIPLGDSLIVVAQRVLGSRDEAQDALQDLYIKLWQQRDTLDNVYNPSGYATRVLKNLCIDRLRTSKPTVELPEELTGFETFVAPIENAERIKALSAQIQKLPKTQRTILEMRTLQDMSYSEISRQTGMSPLTLRVLLSKARKTLRKYGNG